MGGRARAPDLGQHIRGDVAVVEPGSVFCLEVRIERFVGDESRTHCFWLGEKTLWVENTFNRDTWEGRVSTHYSLSGWVPTDPAGGFVLGFFPGAPALRWLAAVLRLLLVLLLSYRQAHCRCNEIIRTRRKMRVR